MADTAAVAKHTGLRENVSILNTAKCTRSTVLLYYLDIYILGGMAEINGAQEPLDTVLVKTDFGWRKVGKLLRKRSAHSATLTKSSVFIYGGEHSYKPGEIGPELYQLEEKKFRFKL